MTFIVLLHKGIPVKRHQRLGLPPQSYPEACFAAPCGPCRERKTVSVVMKTIYVLQEFSLVDGVPREASLLSSSCSSEKGLTFPKLFKSTGQKCPEA